MLSVRRTCPLKLAACSSYRKDPGLFFRAHDHDRLLFWLKPKVTREELWTEGHVPAKRTRRSPTGKGKISRNRRTNARRGSDQERMFFAIQKRPFFFWSQKKFKVEQSFSMGSSVGWVIDRKTRKQSGATGAEPQLSGARMPEQRRSRQLPSTSTYRSYPKEPCC